MNVHLTYCDNHFIMYVNKLIMPSPKTYTVLYVNFISVKLGKNEKNIQIEEE